MRIVSLSEHVQARILLINKKNIFEKFVFTYQQIIMIKNANYPSITGEPVSIQSHVQLFFDIVPTPVV